MGKGQTVVRKDESVVRQGGYDINFLKYILVTTKTPFARHTCAFNSVV